MSEALSNGALIFFCIVSFAFITTLATKSKWWRYAPGRITMWLALGFALCAAYILGRRFNIIPPSWGPWLTFVLFGTFACAIFANLLLLLKRNWNYWAWSPGEDSEHAES